ncbi:MAG: HD domain-containing protein [Eggerthellaceae bacterium]|nr:HD domain-containing protein [Eggerthellaceae bacterium]
MMEDKRSPEEKMELVIRRTKENDATASRTRIMHAYRTAAELHKGVLRKDNKTPYIDHPVSVAEIVAENGGDQNMVIAALLHDTVEDTEYTLESLSVTFGQDVADIVDAVTHVEAIIPDSVTNDHQRRLIKDYIDGLSNAKLLDPSNPQSGKAIYLKLADRLHNMRTLDNCSKASQNKKASDTLQFFVPLAKLIGSKYFERELSELCFSYLQPDLYDEITSAYEETRSRNSRHVESFMVMLDMALRKAPVGQQPLFRKVSSGSCKCYQIRNLLGDTRPFNSTGSFPKSSIYLYEIVLEYQGADEYEMLPRFIDIYDSELRQNGISLRIDFNYPSRSVIAIDLRDRYFNRFLVILRPPAGNSEISDYASLFPPDASITEMPEKVITVYSKDGQPYQMAEGSTVLDFAFRIHPDLGCSAQSALIRRGDSSFQIIPDQDLGEIIISTPADVRSVISRPLQDGDHVLIIADSNDRGEPVYHARYEWFSYVKTPYATEKLSEFFKKMNPIDHEFEGVVSWDPVLSERFKKQNG